MRTVFTCIVLILCSTVMWSQDTQATVKKHHFKGNLLVTPSLEYEHGISDYSTLGLRAGTELLFIENDATDETKFSGLYPFVNAYYRYYYNFDKRTSKGKKTVNNGANYIGVNANYIPTSPIFETDYPTDEDYLFVPSAVWGIQRCFWKNVSFNLELGMGYSISDLDQKLVPVAGVYLGYIFK